MKAASLRTIWAERDRRYGLRLRSLSDTEIRAVREWRWDEAVWVNSKELMEQVQRWQPPFRA
jgi:hypothetical protein